MVYDLIRTELERIVDATGGVKPWWWIEVTSSNVLLWHASLKNCYSTKDGGYLPAFLFAIVGIRNDGSPYMYMRAFNPPPNATRESELPDLEEAYLN